MSNHVSLSHNNVLQRAHQWAHFLMKKHLGVSLANTLFHICKSGQLYPNPTWVIPMRSMGMDVRKATSIWIWKIMTSPYDIQMQNTSNVFLDTMIVVSNMRYFNAQGLRLNIDWRSKQLIMRSIMNKLLVYMKK